VVWISNIRVRGESRLALEECPVSYITGDSVAAVEDFLVYLILLQLKSFEIPKKSNLEVHL